MSRFPPGYRAADLLLHVTSLPSRFGIGDLGPAAFTWIDRICDNSTTRGWFEALPDNRKRSFWNYLRRSAGESREAAAALMRLAWSSAAALAMAPLQDLLNLGAEARMNLPGRTEGNWRWRCAEAMLSAARFDRLSDLTRGSNRSNGPRNASTEDLPAFATKSFAIN